MADKEVKTNISDDKIGNTELEIILDRVLSAHKTDIETWQKEQEKRFEPNIIEIDPDKFVAILDISFMVQDHWDGCNGYFDLRPSEYANVMRSFGEPLPDDNSLFVTRQGLEKIYRFKLKINEVPAENVYQYRIVRAKDAENVGFWVSGITPVQSLEYRMRRASVD